VAYSFKERELKRESRSRICVPPCELWKVRSQKELFGRRNAATHVAKHGWRREPLKRFFYYCVASQTPYRIKAMHNICVLHISGCCALASYLSSHIYNYLAWRKEKTVARSIFSSAPCRSDAAPPLNLIRNAKSALLLVPDPPNPQRNFAAPGISSPRRIVARPAQDADALPLVCARDSVAPRS